jgi:hypothetical protein
MRWHVLVRNGYDAIAGGQGLQEEKHQLALSRNKLCGWAANVSKKFKKKINSAQL